MSAIHIKADVNHLCSKPDQVTIGMVSAIKGFLHGYVLFVSGPQILAPGKNEHSLCSQRIKPRALKTSRNAWTPWVRSAALVPPALPHQFMEHGGGCEGLWQLSLLCSFLQGHYVWFWIMFPSAAKRASLHTMHSNLEKLWSYSLLLSKWTICICELRFILKMMSQIMGQSYP